MNSTAKLGQRSFLGSPGFSTPLVALPTCMSPKVNSGSSKVHFFFSILF